MRSKSISTIKSSKAKAMTLYEDTRSIAYIVDIASVAKRLALHYQMLRIGFYLSDGDRRNINSTLARTTIIGLKICSVEQTARQLKSRLNLEYLTTKIHRRPRLCV